jgi:hypothetical protein
MSESEDYKRGWYDGYQAAQKDSTRIYPTQPVRTEDIMWPDRLPSTSPIPPTMIYDRCQFCGLKSNDVTGYVCYHPNCPTKLTC